MPILISWSSVEVPRVRLPRMICPARAGGFYCWTAKAGLSHVAVRYRRA